MAQLITAEGIKRKEKKKKANGVKVKGGGFMEDLGQS